MTEMENQKKYSDEIDLGAVFARIGDFFSKIGLGFIKFLALLRNVPFENRYTFILLLIIGGVSGFWYSSYLKRKFYESSMILSSEYINKRIVENSVQKLNLLAGEESPKGLAKALHISDTLAANIVEINARPFVSENDIVEMEVLREQLKNVLSNLKSQNQNQSVVEQVIDQIEIENRHAFEFTVRAYSPTAIKPLQDALVQYFEENDYIKKRIQFNSQNLIRRREKLASDSRKLDSLKNIIYSNYKSMSEQSRQGSNNVILTDKAVTNPVEIYSQSLTFYNHLQKAEKEIFLRPDFEVVDGFTEFNEPASASRNKIIGIAMLIGFVLGYVFVALREFNKYLSTIR